MARISQAEAAARARAWGVACEALFMRVDHQPDLTSSEIAQITGLYLDNQRDLFETRIEEIARSRGSYRPALREEGIAYAEMADETAAAVRDGARLFGDGLVSDLASRCEIDPRRARDDSCLHDALAVTVTRHHRECADRLLSGRPVPIICRPSGSCDPVQSNDPVGPPPSALGENNTGTVSPAKFSNGRVREKDSTGSAAMPAGSPCLIMPTDSWRYSSMISASSQLAMTAQVTGAAPDGGPVGRAPSPGADEARNLLRISSALSDNPPSGPRSARDTAWGGHLCATAGSDLASAVMFSEIWDAFIERQLLTGTYSPTRRPELQSTFNMITWLMGGDFPILDATVDFLSELQKRFLTLPVDYKNLRIDHQDEKRWRTYEQFKKHLEALAASGIIFTLVKPKTWNKHKSTLSECVKWAKANRTSMTDLVNGFSGLHIKVPKSTRAAKLEREMTPNSILVALFATPVWTGRSAPYHLCQPGRLIIRDSLYWVPIIETGNGVRREEACQLRVRHIIRRFGIWIINLLAEDIRLKTDEASPRLVLIHREVLDAGFIEALVTGRQPDELLFPELSNENAHCAYGVSYGKRLAGYVNNVRFDLSFMDDELMDEIPDGIADPVAIIAARKHALVIEYRGKFTNHGIRHWWKTTAVNFGCHPSHVDDQLGHVGDTKGEGHRYQKELDLRALKATVDQVPLPFKGAQLRKLYEDSVRARVAPHH